MSSVEDGAEVTSLDRSVKEEGLEMSIEITSLNLVAGTPKHVTIIDHNTSAVLPPTNIIWHIDGSLGGLTMTPDSTGFSFQAPSPMSGNAIATYSSGGVSINGPALVITVTASVQPAYTSP